MWILPLYLHVNKIPDDDDASFYKTLTVASHNPDKAVLQY